MDKVIVIAGPTAVGKTQLSIRLAQIWNGEIINADSMQVYRGLDIGTAKVTSSEKKGVRHHLFDICDVTDNYTVYDYQRDCRAQIAEITKRGKIPILVGGTGYYIQAALFDYQFPKEEEIDLSVDDLSNEQLYQKILEIDAHALIDCHNRRRLLRYYTKLQKEDFCVPKEAFPLYDITWIGLTAEVDKLYERINHRVDQMLIDLVDEVSYFYLQNICSKPLQNGIGYKELYAFFDHEITFKEAVEQIKQNSRNYAKRQFTWFRNQVPDMNWFTVSYDDFENTVSKVLQFLEDHFSCQ